MPVREEFFAIPPKPSGGKLTVLITGGSQGSRTLNRAAQESWPLWEKDAVRLIHQTGSSAYEQLAAELSGIWNRRRDLAVSADMPAAFASADVVVSRAGMSTVSELAAAGKPSILVPLPTAADQHQLRNAEAMERIGAARMVLDAEFSGQRLVEEVLRLSQSPDLLNVMGEAARSFAKPGRRSATRRAAALRWSRSRLLKECQRGMRVDTALKSRNNTLIKCFSSLSLSTSSVSVESA